MSLHQVPLLLDPPYQVTPSQVPSPLVLLQVPLVLAGPELDLNQHLHRLLCRLLSGLNH